MKQSFFIFPIYEASTLVYNNKKEGSDPMRCMRCGCKIEPPHVFCEKCEADMARHPVDKGTPVVIIPRPKSEPLRPRTAKPEDLLSQCRRRIRRLHRLVGVLIAMVLILSVILVFERHPNVRPMGKDYITRIPTQAVTEIIP